VAEAAGLRAGDIVLQAGDRKIQNAETLNQILQTADLKKGLRLFIWRDGVTMYCLLQTGR
jgi:S1-C subfamily serine protease